jgi:hypothetical protein
MCYFGKNRPDTGFQSVTAEPISNGSVAQPSDGKAQKSHY